MSRALTSSIFLLALLFHLSYWQALGDERFEEAYSNLVEGLKEIMVDWNETLPKLPGFECYKNRPIGAPALGKNLEFPCTVTMPSDEIPTSVHRLRPADINVIGAMGDSLSAANGAGACFLPELALEYRGLTFSHGGDEGFETNPTLANVLRKFNPALKGYGWGTGRWDSDEAGMNVGYPGDKANDMPHQADWLIEKMKADPNIDYENDWKVVTLFIGGNDLCAWCKNIVYYASDNYVNFIHESLMTLHDQMPRTIVNVVGLLQVYQVEILSSTICDFIHQGVCSCGMFLTPDELAEFEAMNRQYQVKLTEDINSGQYDDKDDFTVVLQPFLQETAVPMTEDGDPDFSYFAPDCFHFSAKGHAQCGIELWNNMIEPVGNKRVTWDPTVTDISCPTEEFPYIYTNLNSQPEYWEATTPAPPAEGGASITHFSRVFVFCLLCIIDLLRD
ncbi:phospholipase B1, membrane-associated [Strongylocentrotus purpuratus]|uniref:Phospholipase B1, membrane-associated n=1 Tax=Strongylocentrotus purpuratus TaxID=7668 RepID=A0A7M7PPM5_STRPU|nr:phospholipase B1, membrane-associated [Strongylocentrotus purpuratus]